MNTVFIAAMHRSGSTHISKTISAASGALYLPGMLSIGTMGDDPHMIPFEAMQWHSVRLGGVPFVVHQHTLATLGTVKALEHYGINRVVVTIRKIRDCLKSVHVVHANRLSQMPNVHLPIGWREWSQEDQMFFLIRNLSPWLFSFYITWTQRAPNALIVNYEKHYADEAKGNDILFDYLGIVSDTKKFSFPPEADGKLVGEKPKWTKAMTIELDNIARSWGPMYKLMKEDGIV